MPLASLRERIRRTALEILVLRSTVSCGPWFHRILSLCRRHWPDSDDQLRRVRPRLDIQKLCLANGLFQNRSEPLNESCSLRSVLCQLALHRSLVGRGKPGTGGGASYVSTI